MSGTSYSTTCPKCGANMGCYYDWKPYDTVNGQCLECGFSYYTKETQMSLKEVNNLRTGRDLPELEKLRRQAN